MTKNQKLEKKESNTNVNIDTLKAQNCPKQEQSHTQLINSRIFEQNSPCKDSITHKSNGRIGFRLFLLGIIFAECLIADIPFQKAFLIALIAFFVAHNVY